MAKKLTMFFSFAFFLVALWQVAIGVSRESISLNTQGYRAHKHGDFDKAAKLFETAVAADDTNALAHYNLACALSRDQSDILPLKVILEHLQKAIQLDPNRKQRVLSDPDLVSVRNTLFFRILSGSFNPQKVEDIERLFKNEVLEVSHWTTQDNCGGGMYENRLRLDDQGVLFSGCMNSDEPERLAKNFKVVGNEIQLTEPANSIRRLIFGFDGIEGYFRGVDAEGRTMDTWHEIRGYFGEP